eukprot:7982719-Prorocentrum_lima.AAC.1
MEVFEPTTGTGVGHVLSSIEARSTLPKSPPVSKEQWKAMTWIHSLPRGAVVHFGHGKNQKRFPCLLYTSDAADDM